MQDNENKTKIYTIFWEYWLKLFTADLAIRKVSRIPFNGNDEADTMTPEYHALPKSQTPSISCRKKTFNQFRNSSSPSFSLLTYSFVNRLFPSALSLSLSRSLSLSLSLSLLRERERERERERAMPRANLMRRSNSITLLLPVTV